MGAPGSSGDIHSGSFYPNPPELQNHQHYGVPSTPLSPLTFPESISSLPVASTDSAQSSRLSMEDRLDLAYETLRDGRLDPLDLMIAVLDRDNPRFSSCRRAMYQFDVNKTKIVKILDAVFHDREGSDVVRAWMKPHAINMVRDVVGKEMGDAQKVLATPTGAQELTHDFVWNCLLKHSADAEIKCAIIAARSPHLFTYDNVNLGTSIHTEQRGVSTPGKVQSGTYAVIYALRNAHPAHMRLEPILRRQQLATELSWTHDLRPTLEQSTSVFNQLSINITHILITYSDKFSKYADDPRLQYPVRRKIPLGFKTQQFPLRLSTIEEASIEGNLAVHEDVYINQLRFQESELNDLGAYADSNPSADDLLACASEILQTFATPTAHPRDKPPKNVDAVSHNIRLLTRDLLYLMILVSAIADGDFGRIEDFLPQLAMMFRGAGSNNYCTEILHFIFNLKKVWPQEFANIMRDNMLLNISGLPGHAMPVDLNIEHLIGYLKTLLVVKGLYSTWEHLGDASACIVQLQHLKKEMGLALASTYHGSSHTSPDTSHLVWRVADKASELNLQCNDSSPRQGTLVKDILLVEGTCNASWGTEV
ncbi:hypothetical protein ONZ45_g16837 [Pleurotus djamor]|nr:hypothetical protein ONZ45_g16837 [Pleurotus djamor]